MDSLICNQDLNQKLGVLFRVSIEFYRVIISSLLLLFVPQKCGDHVCSMSENMVIDNELYFSGIVINIITMAAFFIMYICEIRREEKLIKLLEVNNNISTDSQSVSTRIEILYPYKKIQLVQVTLYYQYSSYFSIIIFVMNTIISGIILNNYSLGNQTLLNYITNVLFMIGKLSDVFITVYTDKNIFYSAYLTRKVQFNDIDPREVSKVEHRTLLQCESVPLYKSDNYDVVEIQTIQLTSPLSSSPSSKFMNNNKTNKGNDIIDNSYMYDISIHNSDTSSEDIETKVLKIVFREPELFINL